MTMQRFYRRPFWAVITLSLIAAFAGTSAAAASGGGGSDERTYLVTIENLTAGQPFTPPVAVTHNRRTGVFSPGEAASAGIQGLAENGDVPSLVAELQADPRVDEIVVADANGPVLPGGSVTFEITAERGRRRLSVASMLICTNDGFAGLDSLRLPGARGKQTVAYADGYDAGTEINTEDFDDLVPPCGPLTGVDSMGAGTGMSNPALAEAGVIAHHGGITGAADLQPDLHGFTSPVAKITITRIDGAAVYEVDIENESDGQPFTPPVVVTHRRGFDLFTVGDEANGAIQGLAENGDVPGVVAAVEGRRGVSGVYVDNGPVLPDGETTLTVYAQPGARRITLASMLICTNDGFTGLDGERLPRWVGESVEYEANGYDAGTEINTEDFDDIVPPCGPLTGVDSMGAGTGMSNPALAEGGVIAHHGGITGAADLIPDLHGWDDPIMEVTITRVG
jgi:Spondin_N